MEEVRHGERFGITTAWGEDACGYHIAEPEGRTEEERVAQRDLTQRLRSRDVLNKPLHEAAGQARSSMMAMFLDQFSRLADGDESDPATAHVRDLGLVFRGPILELERIAFKGATKLEGGDDVEEEDRPLQPPCDVVRSRGSGAGRGTAACRE